MWIGGQNGTSAIFLSGQETQICIGSEMRGVLCHANLIQQGERWFRCTKAGQGVNTSQRQGTIALQAVTRAGGFC